MNDWLFWNTDQAQLKRLMVRENEATLLLVSMMREALQIYDQLKW